AGVDGCALVVIGGFDDAAPEERVNRLRLGSDAQDGRAGDAGIAEELERMRVLGIAHCIEDTDKNERGDGPAASPKFWAFGSDFAVGKAQEPGHGERRQKRGKEQRLKDEDDVPRIPARVERKKWAQAIVIGEVEQQMAQIGDERE